MQVPTFRRGAGPFIGENGGELAGLVIVLRRLHLNVPGVACLGGIGDVGRRGLDVKQSRQHAERLQAAGADVLSRLGLGERAVGIVELRDGAHELRVIRHGHEIERPATLRGDAVDRDGQALAELVGLIGRRARPERPRRRTTSGYEDASRRRRPGAARPECRCGRPAVASTEPPHRPPATKRRDIAPCQRYGPGAENGEQRDSLDLHSNPPAITSINGSPARSARSSPRAAAPAQPASFRRRARRRSSIGAAREA